MAPAKARRGRRRFGRRRFGRRARAQEIRAQEIRAQEVRTGLAWLHAADPVLARLIDDHPGFDPDAWARRLPALGLFGALVFQVIGQQISVIAATAIFGRLTQAAAALPLHRWCLRDVSHEMPEVVLQTF
jgi:3-methyladenine DNA glycosylase/8-oxoguanine DNA glycosylase